MMAPHTPLRSQMGRNLNEKPSDLSAKCTISRSTKKNIWGTKNSRGRLIGCKGTPKKVATVFSFLDKKIEGGGRW